MRIILKIIFVFFLFFINSIKANENVMRNEICFTIDVSSSIIAIHDTSRKGTIEDIFCFIQSKMKEFDLDYTDFYLNMYAKDVITYQFTDFQKHKDLTDSVQNVLDEIIQLTTSRPGFFEKSYLTLAILNSYKLISDEPDSVFQEIYLFTDNDIVFPEEIEEPIRFSDLSHSLDSLNINNHDRRSFYYFSLFTPPDMHIQDIVKKEGGETYQGYEKNICESFRFYNVNIVIKVLDPLLNPLPKAFILNNRNSDIFETDSNGYASFISRTQIPTITQFEVSHIGFETNYTHAFLEDDSIEIVKLEPIMLQSQPVFLNFDIKNQDGNAIFNSFLTIDNTRKKRNYQLINSQERIKYNEFVKVDDILKLEIKNSGYQTYSRDILMDTWKQEINLEIIMQRK